VALRLESAPGAPPGGGSPLDPGASPLLQDWRDQLEDTLDQIAGELPEDCRCSEALLHDELVLLLVQLAYAALLDAQGGSAHLRGLRGTLESPDAERAWSELLALIQTLKCEWLDASPTFPVLAQCVFSASAVRSLVDWMEHMARQASGSEDGPVRQLGALHETLLGVRFERLISSARRLRKGRAWIRPARVLSWAPELRAKRLQRELGLSKHSVDAFGPKLARATTRQAVELALEALFETRIPARAAGSWVVQPSSQRRHRGAHYTPRALCEELVQRTLAPILAQLPEPRSRALLELRVCDPALGAGAFLIAAADYLAERLEQAWRAEGARSPQDPPDAERRGLADARREVASRVLFGVDKNPLAVALARLTLSLFAFGPSTTASCLRQSLRVGDALIGDSAKADEAASFARLTSQVPDCGALGLHWAAIFPQAFERANPGFDAVIGNPPWVAYVGRAAQPIAPAIAAYYAATNPAFKRYRTLHGLFVYRSAALLREGGRLGLVLPTSVADLEGYSATRAAHDALCSVDTELPDWGDGAFAEVFQPAMALLSTRRSSSDRGGGSALWPLAREDLGGTQRGLLDRLRGLPVFPRELFGERGFQTTRDDQAYLTRSCRPLSASAVALREGADIGEFRALVPQLFADSERLGPRLRPATEWQKVALLIRQTARFPIAAYADGAAFRNSVLAGFESPEWPAAVLLCLLNSSLLRWFHFTLQRDARQGMPQMKIGHLRALPALPANAPRARQALLALGARIAARNDGIRADERAELEDQVNDAFALDGAEREVVATWALTHPPPISRRRTPEELVGPLANGLSRGF
jgi:hypothetical protein